MSVTIPFIERLKERQPDGTVYLFRDIWWIGTLQQRYNLQCHIRWRDPFWKRP